MGKPEASVESYLCKRAEELGALVRKVEWIGVSNAPDRVLMFPIWGTIWVEAKANRKKPTEAQSREHRRMREHGQTVYWVNSRRMVDEMFLDIEQNYIGR